MYTLNAMASALLVSIGMSFGSRVGLVGQSLLAVRFHPAEAEADSQEWLSY